MPSTQSPSKPRRQCAKCPWKTSTDPHDIPNYDEEQHEKLTRTIAEPANLRDVTSDDPFPMMACHETVRGKELPCVGWLYNQLGEGNNLALRLKVFTGEVDAHFEIDGPQHPNLEETLPK